MWCHLLSRSWYITNSFVVTRNISYLLVYANNSSITIVRVVWGASRQATPCHSDCYRVLLGFTMRVASPYPVSGRFIVLSCDISVVRLVYCLLSSMYSMLACFQQIKLMAAVSRRSRIHYSTSPSCPDSVRPNLSTIINCNPKPADFLRYFRIPGSPTATLYF